MKRFFTVLLTALLTVSLVACGGKADDNAAESTFAGKLLADFKAEADGKTAIELAESLSGKEYVPFMAGTMEVEPGYLNGFDTEITGFSDGAMFAPMIGSIPFVSYIFRLDAGSSVDAFTQTLKDHADLRWNICTSADEMLCEAVGNTVFFVMSPLTFEE